MATDKVLIHVYGPRNQITAQCVVPAHMVHDLDILVDEIQQVHPTFTYQQALRFVYVRGLDSLRTALDSNSLPDPHRETKPKTTPRS